MSQAIERRRIDAGYDAATLRQEAAGILAGVAECADREAARRRMLANVLEIHTRGGGADEDLHHHTRRRDCAHELLGVLSERADRRAGFSVAQALWDVAAGRDRPELDPGFYAEIIHWALGLERRSSPPFLAEFWLAEAAEGLSSGEARSWQLDRLWQEVDRRMSRYPHGLDERVRQARAVRRQRVLEALGGSEADWNDWRWHVRHAITDADALARVARVSPEEMENIRRATAGGLPFAVTPYYASLMDDAGDADRAVRAQVIPPEEYVEQMLARGEDAAWACDFMRESDTSPVELVTRRYPAIAILKPYLACPQVCVYCQRNWELRGTGARDALAPRERVEAAVAWLASHPAIREVLITGGDPLGQHDEFLLWLLGRLARIDHVDLIRIGTRTPVTLPMRITEELAAMLGSFRKPGGRDVAVVTHVEHPYEVTDDLARAVDHLKRAGISVYNQQVYTFFVSRRFESALLRMLLRRIGIDPYYTFAPKGKEETNRYRVPLARLLQEQKEEVRLLPGLRRGDEPVYNVPALGKNYLRAVQHRDLLSVLPSGARVYEFHPWEKNILPQKPFTTVDVPILDYLERLAAIGEDPADYESIWYYF